MKTSQALYEALEAVGRAQEAMLDDFSEPDTTEIGWQWLKLNHDSVAKAYTLIEEVRDSLNEGD